jgi:hypothetical protein
VNHPEDDEIDALLREHFDGPVPDDGFTDRLMRQPRPRRRRAAWPVVAGVAAGVGACWTSLLPTPLLQAGWQGWTSGQPSAAAIVLLAAGAGMSLLGCWWATMEPEGS